MTGPRLGLPPNPAVAPLELAPPNAQVILQRLVRELPRFRYAATTEDQLQRALGSVLVQIGIEAHREYVAGPADRFDFLCPCGVVVEAKIKGSYAAAVMQVARYCQRDDVSAVVVVTTRRHWRTSSEELHGKPVRFVYVGGALL